MKLNDSGVRFVEDTHQYFLGDKELFGITGMLSRQLFPNEYAGIDTATLEAAANRGTNIHRSCGLVDNLGVMDCREAELYYELTRGLKHEQTEYIVTDREYFATAIDKVYRTGEDTFTLADIKTTYSLNKEKTQWQLSIEAYLFERQNPGARVDRLVILWLRIDKRGEQSELVEVKRIPDRDIERLLTAEREGVKLPAANDMPQEVVAMQEKIIAQLNYVSTLQADIDELKAGLLERMQNLQVKSWEGDLLKITRKEGSTRYTLDTKRMRKEHPELEALFQDYETETKTKESLLITIKK